MAFTVDQEVEDFLALKRSQTYVQRNFDYFLLREAFEGRFRWPTEWPKHKPKLIHNLVKRISMRYSSLLMGKGFQIQVPAQGVEDDDRLRSQGVEKLLYRIMDKSGGISTFSLGAQDGAKLGNTVFKSYIDPKTKWPTFKQCVPDYFYGMPSSVDYSGALSKVYYLHSIDIIEAKKLYGDRDYENTLNARTGFSTDIIVSKEFMNRSQQLKARQVQVLEVWTEEDYLLLVGGQVIYNGPNPYGFVPFVSIPNIRVTGKVEGLSDVGDVLPVNEELNMMISHRSYIVKRWLNPTLIWEGAPKDYASVIQKIIGGGGVIPARLGAKLYFLAHQGQGPDVIEMLERLRLIALENANMNDLALSGNVQGSVNTGESLDRMLISIVTTLEEKHRNWEAGLRQLFAQLLDLAVHKDSTNSYGEAMYNLTSKSAVPEGVVELTPELIGDIRDVKILWPGTLAKDDAGTARLEIEKRAAMVQSLFTTMERLGIEHPDDEIERMARENEDPRLAPKENANLLRAATPLLQSQLEQGGLPEEDVEPGLFEEPLPGEEEPVPPRRRRRPKPEPTEPEVTYTGDEPLLEV